MCADCRSTSLEEQANPAHPMSVGNPVITRTPLNYTTSGQLHGSTGHGYWPVTHVTHPDLLTHLTHDPWPIVISAAYQVDVQRSEVVGALVADWIAWTSAYLRLFAVYSSAYGHMLHHRIDYHQLLIDSQRSEKTGPAESAAATNQSSWWSANYQTIITDIKLESCQHQKPAIMHGVCRLIDTRPNLFNV